MAQLFKIEIKRLFSEIRNYKLNNIVSVIDALLICFGIFIGTGADIFPYGTLFYALIGMILWRYTLICLQTSCNIIQKEIRIGTLAQLLLAKYSLEQILFVRLLAKLLVESGKIFICSVVLVIGFQIRADKTVNYIVLFLAILCCMIGMLGMSYIVAGFALVYKKANAIINAISYFTLFFVGMTIPLEKLPQLFSGVAYSLPFYWCINVIKTNSDIHSIIYLFITAHIWVAFGILCFRISLRKVLTKGTISGY